MVQTSYPERNVKRDFVNLTKFRIKKKYSEMLLKQWELGNLKLSVSQKLKNDGETTFETSDCITKFKKSTVTIKKSVAESGHICWRMSILLHELAHVLHYFITKDGILIDETHGEDWRIKLKQSMERGSIKKCAELLESPHPTCLYKRDCIWCLPEGAEAQENVNYILPRVQERSSFGGNCLFCFTSDSTIKHIKRSNVCKEKYASLYGPEYKAKIFQIVAKEKRVMKRQGKPFGTPVCCFCPGSGDKFLFVHLKFNSECARKYINKYKCQNEEELRDKIFKEKAKLRKRKQRAKAQQERK